MDRRDALKALTSLAASTGLSVTPVTAQDVDRLELVIIRVKGRVTQELAERIRALWKHATEGTVCEGIRTIVIDEQLDVEFVRR